MIMPASIAHQIFVWKAEGIGNTTIARRLNDSNIPCPAMYHYKQGHYTKKQPVGAGALWKGQIIKLMTINPIYTGHMAQGKTKKALCDGLPTTSIPRSEWIIVKNTHEAIIDEETFELIQQMKADIRETIIANRGKYNHLGVKANMFTGILYCGDCKTKLVRYKDATKTSVRYYQQCRVYNENLSGGCVQKSTREEVIEQAVFAVLKNQIEIAADMKKLINKFNRSTAFKKDVKQLEQQIFKLQQKIKRVITLKNVLFESLEQKLLSEEDFVYLKEKYNADSVGLKEELRKSEYQLTKYHECLTAQNKWLSTFEKYAKETVLTKEMLSELVERVWVWAGHRFEVVLNFRDEFEVILSNVEGAQEICQAHSLST